MKGMDFHIKNYSKLMGSNEWKVQKKTKQGLKSNKVDFVLILRKCLAKLSYWLLTSDLLHDTSENKES